jgi:hypothetical protein
VSKIASPDKRASESTRFLLGHAIRWKNGKPIAAEFFWSNANTGCRDPKVLDINRVCMDWGKGRAHSTVPGKPKRRLRRTGADFDVGPCNNSSLRCSRQWWNEVACTWR